MTTTGSSKNLIRFSTSRQDDDSLEIHSCITETTMLLPAADIEPLIAMLTMSLQPLPEREIISLDPFSEIYGTSNKS